MDEADRYAKLLMTIPGVGHYSTILISSEIADIDRFPDYEHLCSYAKLSPGVHQSGDTQHTFKGTGNSMLNWVMVQCTRVHFRRCDSAITRFYEQESAHPATTKTADVLWAQRRHSRTLRSDCLYHIRSEFLKGPEGIQ